MAMGFRFSRLIVYLLFLPTLLINPVVHLRGANGAVACVPDLIPDKEKLGIQRMTVAPGMVPDHLPDTAAAKKQPGSATFPGPVAFAVCRCGQSKAN
jgi:hypothetical protein